MKLMGVFSRMIEGRDAVLVVDCASIKIGVGCLVLEEKRKKVGGWAGIYASGQGSNQPGLEMPVPDKKHNSWVLFKRRLCAVSLFIAWLGRNWVQEGKPW
jgi:hypothetical protein